MFWRRHPIRDADLSAYVDGQLEPPARDRLEAHIETCDPCREALAELRMLRSALRELPPATAPRSFALREADVRAEAKPSLTPARPPALLGGLASVALVAFVALVGVDVFSQPSTGGDTDATGAAALEALEDGVGLNNSTTGNTGDTDGGSLAGLQTVEPDGTETFGYFPADDASGPETNQRGQIDGTNETTAGDALATPDCPPGRECGRAAYGFDVEAQPGPEAAPGLAAQTADDSRLPLRAGEAAAAVVALVAGGSFALIWRRRV